MATFLSPFDRWAALVCLAFSAGVAPAAQAGTPPPLIPIADFASGTAFAKPALSPDGRAVAAEFRKDGKHLLVIHEVVDGGSKGTRTYNLGDAEFNWARWSDDGHIVVSVRRIKKYLGEEYGFDRLLLVDRDGRSAKPIGPEVTSVSGDDVIYWAPDGSHLLLNVSRSIFNWPDVVRVDLPSGAATIVQKSREETFRWIADSSGVVVAGMGFVDWRRFRVIYRASAGEPWSTAFRMRMEDDESERVLITRIDSNARSGHVLSRHGGDRWGLYEYDFKANTFGKPLFANPQYDLWGFDYDADNQLLWVSHVDDRQHLTWIDEAGKGFYDDVVAAVPGKTVTVPTSSRTGDVRIVRTSSPTDPGSWYYFTAASGKMVRLARNNEKLDTALLAPTRYVAYPARDGETIPAYLTLPAGRDPAALPLVVMPHAGPLTRDTGDFDLLVQYLANRGYAVLQPNFRGSLGYGRRFQELGYGQFGKAMQDDLDDGVKWLVAAGQVDPRRVCILGHGYGGYAAQVAAFRNPEAYRCAASIAGISDLKAMVRLDRWYLNIQMFGTWMSWVQDSAATRKVDGFSSLAGVDALKVPLLLVHGTKDTVVPVKQSDKLSLALRAAGKPYEYLRIEGGDHALDEEGQRAELLRWLDRFLGTHNPTDVLKAGTPAVAAVTAPGSP